jgi:hypothetical protein
MAASTRSSIDFRTGKVEDTERYINSEGRTVSVSSRVLIVGGVVSLFYGFLLGFPLTAARMKAPSASRHLVTAHLSAIIQGATLLALASVMTFSDLPKRIETVAAGLLVAGSVLFVAGAIANWRQDVGDHFAQRSIGWKLFAASGPANVVGAATVLVGVLRGL